MAKGHISGVMEHNTMESGSAISSMVKESTNGPMADDTREAGRKISFTSKASIHGQTVGSTMESTMKIRSMDSASTCGQTVRDTKATGETVNSTGKVVSPTLLARVASEFGSTETERNGFQATSTISRTSTKRVRIELGHS